MTDAERSQIGISVPFHGDIDGVMLLCVDETGHIAEAATSDVDGFLEQWRPLPPGGLPFADWQRTLAKHAGYRDLSKWCCRDCDSVCLGEADEIPSPCEFCGSDHVEAVSIETSLSPPRPPFLADEEPDALELCLFASPFGASLLELITHGPRTQQPLPRLGV